MYKLKAINSLKKANHIQKLPSLIQNLHWLQKTLEIKYTNGHG